MVTTARSIDAYRWQASSESPIVENDAITRSPQLLKVIQADATQRPYAIIVEPLRPIPHSKVVAAAATAGIGWAVTHREPEYTTELGRTAQSPGFFRECGAIENWPNPRKNKSPLCYHAVVLCGLGFGEGSASGAEHSLPRRWFTVSLPLTSA